MIAGKFEYACQIHREALRKFAGYLVAGRQLEVPMLQKTSRIIPISRRVRESPTR